MLAAVLDTVNCMLEQHRKIPGQDNEFNQKVLNSVNNINVSITC